MQQNNIEKAAIEFISNIFVKCFDSNSVDFLQKSIANSGTCIGLEVIENIFCDKASFSFNKKKDSNEFKTTIINESTCIVNGDFEYLTENREKGLLDFTAICNKDNGEHNILHIHISTNSKEIREDSTQNKQLMQQLNELKKLTNSLAGGIIDCKMNDELTILSASEGFLKLIGYSKNEISNGLKTSYYDVVYENDKKELRKSLKKQLEKCKNYSAEYRVIKKDGTIVWVLDRGILIKDKLQGLRLNAIIIDITNQKRQEQQALYNAKKYEMAIELSQITLFDYDIKQDEILLTKEFLKLYNVKGKADGIKPDYLIQSGAIDKMHVKEYKRMFKEIQSGAPFSHCQVITHDVHGNENFFELSLTTIYSDEGEALSAIGVRKSIKELMQLKKEKEFANNAVSDKILLCEGNITNNSTTFINEEWKNIFKFSIKNSFSEILEKLVIKLAKANNEENINSEISLKNVKKQFEKEKANIICEYKLKEKNYVKWFEFTLNTIEYINEFDSVLITRIYIKDIHERKQAEILQEQRRKIYNNMLAENAVISYEINVNEDKFLHGNEYWLEYNEIMPDTTFTSTMQNIAKEKVHEEDKSHFLNAVGRKNLILRFSQGEKEVSLDYRKKEDDEEDYRWWNCKIYLYSNTNTSDICALIYIKDINEEKLEELSLRFVAEHDAMTGLYNKAATEQRITSFFESTHDNTKFSGVILVDLDNFKPINDTFGHAYGDEVIVEAAKSIQKLFRQGDIVGRIGGDEFCVFLKKVDSKRILETKAKEICETLSKTYKKDGKEISISASVGIAITGDDDCCYKTIIAKADKAMYRAKKAGKKRISY